MVLRWVDDFSRLRLDGGPAHEQWASDFVQQQKQHPPGRTASWNQIWDDTAGPSNEWATEFGKAEAATVLSLGPLVIAMMCYACVYQALEIM